MTHEQLIQKIESIQDDGSEGYPFSQDELDLMLMALRSGGGEVTEEMVPMEPIQIYDETFYSEAGMTRGTYTENHKAALQAVFNARIAAPSPAKKEGENYSKSLVSWASAEVGFWKARSLSADAELKYQHQRATEAELKLEAERKDAERYRWLCLKTHNFSPQFRPEPRPLPCPDKLPGCLAAHYAPVTKADIDAAIDAARKESK